MMMDLLYIMRARHIAPQLTVAAVRHSILSIILFGTWIFQDFFL